MGIQTDKTADAFPDSKIFAANGPIVKLIKAIISQVLAIYAFGSYLTPNTNADSDLDLAVLLPGYADPLQLWELSGQLADVAACLVDLLDMRAASTVMQYQILQTGRLLWAQEPQTGLFECFVLSEKTALDAARAPLLQDIQNRGYVYGR